MHKKAIEEVAQPGSRRRTKPRPAMTWLGGAASLLLISTAGCDGCQTAVHQSTDAGAPTPSASAAALVLAPVDITHGPIVGEVTSRSATVWARSAAGGQLRVELAAGDTIVGPQSASFDPDRDNVAKITFDGLEPDTTYEVRAWPLPSEEQGGPPPGRPPKLASFATAPANDVGGEVKIAFGGDLGGQNFCRDREEGYVIFDVVAKQSPNAFIGLGDMIYADGTCKAVGRYGNFQLPSRFPASTKLDHFMAHWRYNWSDDNFRRLMGQVPYYAVWDDHETENDAGPQNPLMEPARRAMLAYAPIPNGIETLYRNVRWGKHLELFFLDTRQYRSPNSEPDSATKTMLGEGQKAWLIDSFAASTATWKVIVSSVPIGIPTGGEPDEPRDGWASEGGNTGFETELRSLFESFAEQGARDVIFISTDVHFASAQTYKPLGTDKAFTVHELVVGPLAAGLYPKEDLDKTFNPERDFYHGPPSTTAIDSYTLAKPWLTFGLLDVNAKGTLELTVWNGIGERVYDKKLSP